MAQWKILRGLFSRPKEKIEITIETNESWEISWFRKSRTESCPVCRTETISVPEELGAEIIGKDLSEIRELMRNEEIHYFNPDGNETLICLASLKKAFERSRSQRILRRIEE